MCPSFLDGYFITILLLLLNTILYKKKMPARVTRVPTRRWVNPTTTKTIVHRFFFALAHTLQKKVADEDDSTS